MSFCGGWWGGVVGGGWGGLHSHFHIQPNYCVEVVLYCIVVGVGVVTKSFEHLNEDSFEQDERFHEIHLSIYMNTH